MEIEISLDQYYGLTKRLDGELASALFARLQAHDEIDLVEPRKLGTGIIFGAQTGEHRFELRSPFAGAPRTAGDQCTFSTSTAKYISTRSMRSRLHDSWQLDATFGDGGYCTFCSSSIDEDSVLQIADLIATTVLHSLSPMHAK